MFQFSSFRERIATPIQKMNCVKVDVWCIDEWWTQTFCDDFFQFKLKKNKEIRPDFCSDIGNLFFHPNAIKRNESQHHIYFHFYYSFIYLINLLKRQIYQPNRIDRVNRFLCALKIEIWFWFGPHSWIIGKCVTIKFILSETWHIIYHFFSTRLTTRKKRLKWS